jgi:hypothetical protein
MKSRPKNIAVLNATNSNCESVIKIQLDLARYYEDLHPLIDDSKYRRKSKISTVLGILYGNRGQVVQEFHIAYDSQGQSLAGWARHEDGTVTKFGLLS